MIRLTAGEAALLNIYAEGSKQETVEYIQAALPYMDTGTRKVARTTIKKVKAMTAEEFAEYVGFSADGS